MPRRPIKSSNRSRHGLDGDSRQNGVVRGDEGAKYVHCVEEAGQEGGGGRKDSAAGGVVIEWARRPAVGSGGHPCAGGDVQEVLVKCRVGRFPSRTSFYLLVSHCSVVDQDKLLAFSCFVNLDFDYVVSVLVRLAFPFVVVVNVLSDFGRIDYSVISRIFLFPPATTPVSPLHQPRAVVSPHSPRQNGTHPIKPTYNPHTFKVSLKVSSLVLAVKIHDQASTIYVPALPGAFSITSD